METKESRRKRATLEAMRKIAKYKIEYCNLPDTVDEYIEKCKVKS